MKTQLAVSIKPITSVSAFLVLLKNFGFKSRNSIRRRVTQFTLSFISTFTIGLIYISFVWVFEDVILGFFKVLLQGNFV